MLGIIQRFYDGETFIATGLLESWDDLYIHLEQVACNIQHNFITPLVWIQHFLSPLLLKSNLWIIRPVQEVSLQELIISLTDNLPAELPVTLSIGTEGGIVLDLVKNGMERTTPVRWSCMFCNVVCALKFLCLLQDNN